MERITITGVGSQLQGVGRLPDGRAAFVPGAIPGEVVGIEITQEKGRFCEASLSAVLEPSPDRVSPACPHAGTCGGCQGRHMRYERTLSLKRQIVYDALNRVGGIEAPRVLKGVSPDLPVIMLSSEGTPQKLMETLKLGALDFIQKPYTSVQIKKALESIRKKAASNE